MVWKDTNSSQIVLSTKLLLKISSAVGGMKSVAEPSIFQLSLLWVFHYAFFFVISPRVDALSLSLEYTYTCENFIIL